MNGYKLLCMDIDTLEIKLLNNLQTNLGFL